MQEYECTPGGGREGKGWANTWLMGSSRLSEYHTENVYRGLIKDSDKNRKEKKMSLTFLISHSSR